MKEEEEEAVLSHQGGQISQDNDDDGDGMGQIGSFSSSSSSH